MRWNNNNNNPDTSNMPLRKMPLFHLISWRGNFVERHSFRTRKLGEITTFYAVISSSERSKSLQKLLFPSNFYTRELSKIKIYHAVNVSVFDVKLQKTFTQCYSKEKTGHQVFPINATMF